ncbi:MAG: hypothetical protein HY399_00865 [Elusimicrobia bacterium]|nr:hypothetical protein [Elusimicrobiota bacterium]
MAEKYSRAGPGNLWWTSLKIPLTATWTGLAHLEHLRRFNHLDTAGAVGAAWKREGQGGYFQVQISPHANILSRWNLEGAWDYSLFKGLYLEGSARAAEYIPAHVYSGSLGVYLWPMSWTELLLRGTSTLTRFRQAPTTLRPGILGLANLFLYKETLRLTPSIGYYEEPFESGAPGSLNAFKAILYHLGIGFRPSTLLEIKLDGDYEDRNDKTFVRRGQLSISYQF